MKSSSTKNYRKNWKIMLGILSEAAAVENSHNSEHLIRQVMRETG